MKNSHGKAQIYQCLKIKLLHLLIAYTRK